MTITDDGLIGASGRTRDDFQRLSPDRSPGDLQRRIGLGGVLAALGLHAQPVRCGRFELEEKLGEGAMGVVYRAFDPELERHVALKILHDASDRALPRLRREARALARQQHPNIVQVFAAGRDHGQIWIAMELVEGVSLSQWSARHPPGEPGRRALALGLLRTVGEALAAAHAAGLVHRDVKPANVLVRADGFVKLADFGLARMDVGSPTHETAPHGESEALDALGDLSRTGAIVGTPRYMAPEQLDGLPADARSDQFAFAVTAWEVLSGAHPFEGRTLLELREAIEARQLVERNADEIPIRLRLVLRRALAPSAADRFTNMDELLTAWSRALASRRITASLGAIALVGAVALLIASARDEQLPCDGRNSTAAFKRVWNPHRRTAVFDALSRHDRKWTQSTKRALDDALDVYGRRWVEADIATCKARRAQDGPEVLLDGLVACRTRAFDTVDAVLDQIASDPDGLAERVGAMVSQLPIPSACLSGAMAEPPAIARSLRRDLAQAEASHIAGRYEEALATALSVASEARAPDLRLLASEALLVAGTAASNIGDERAVELMMEAYVSAMAHGDVGAPLAFRAAVGVAGRFARLENPEAARPWLRHAEAVVPRLPASSDRDATMMRVECMILEAEGRLEQALERCTAAVDLLERSTEFDRRLRTRRRTEIESLHHSLGRYAEALALALVLRDEAEAELGPWHPTTGGLSMNIGNAALRTEDFELAEASFLRAIEIFRAAHGESHHWVVSAIMNLGNVYKRRHDYGAAEAAYEQALAAAGDRRDVKTARVLHNLAEARRKLGRPEDALELLARVRVIEEAELAPDHLQRATTHHTTGNAYLDLGLLEQAEDELRRAREIWDRSGRTRLDELDESFERLRRLRAEAEGRP